MTHPCQKLIPLVAADLRGALLEPLETLRDAKLRGAALFVVSATQLGEFESRGALTAEFLVEWSPAFDPVRLDAAFNRFLVGAAAFEPFARWARQRLGNLEVVLRLSSDDERDLDGRLLPRLRAREGLRAVLAPIAASPCELLAAGRRLLDRTDLPLALLPAEGVFDPDGFTLAAASLMESGRVHTVLFPGRDAVGGAVAGTSLLNALELRRFGINYVSCPTCGRCEIPLEEIVGEVRRRTAHISTPLDVAIMGCVVNGPGESRHADLGIAGGHSGGVLIKNGAVVGKLENHQFVDVLVDEIEKMAAVRDGSEAAPAVSPDAPSQARPGETPLPGPAASARSVPDAG